MIKSKNEYLAAKRRTQIGNAVFNVINALVLAFLVVVTVYPFWNTIAISFKKIKNNACIFGQPMLL